MAHVGRAGRTVGLHQSSVGTAPCQRDRGGCLSLAGHFAAAAHSLSTSRFALDVSEGSSSSKKRPQSGSNCTVAGKLRRHDPLPEQRKSPLLILCSSHFVVFKVCSLGERIREGPLSGASCTVASKLRRHVPMLEQRSPLLILCKVLCSRSPLFVVFRVRQLSKKMWRSSQRGRRVVPTGPMHQNSVGTTLQEQRRSPLLIPCKVASSAHKRAEYP